MEYTFQWLAVSFSDRVIKLQSKPILLGGQVAAGACYGPVRRLLSSLLCIVPFPRKGGLTWETCFVRLKMSHLLV